MKHLVQYLARSKLSTNVDSLHSSPSSPPPTEEVKGTVSPSLFVTFEWFIQLGLVSF